MGSVSPEAICLRTSEGVLVAMIRAGLKACTTSKSSTGLQACLKRLQYRRHDAFCEIRAQAVQRVGVLSEERGRIDRALCGLAACRVVLLAEDQARVVPQHHVRF